MNPVLSRIMIMLNLRENLEFLMMKAPWYIIFKNSLNSKRLKPFYIIQKGYDYIAGEFEEPNYEGRTMKEIETYRKNMTFLARNRPKAYNKGKRPGVNLYKDLAKSIKPGFSYMHFDFGANFDSQISLFKSCRESLI